MIYSKRLFFFTALLLLLACSGGENAEKEALLRQQKGALAVATTPTLDCLPVFIAQERGMFQDNKVEVFLMPMMAQMDCQEALLKERAQLVAADVMRCEKMRREGSDLHYVTATNIQWQLISNRLARITDIKQMGDKMMAMTRYSATDFLSRQVVDSVKPKNKVFYIQINDVLIRLKMLINNEMDAVWLPEPQATEARQDKHPVLYDTKGKNWYFGCFVTLSKTWNETKRKKQIDDFIKVYNMACDSLNQKGMNHYADVIQKYCHVTEKTIKALPNTTFPHAGQPPQYAITKAQNMNWND